MKLYIKQKVFSLKDRYDIYDGEGNVVYYVTSEFFTIGAKLHIYDANGAEQYYIRQRITFLLSQYEIYRNDKLYATVNQEFSFFKGKLKVNSDLGQFQLNGDFLDMDYDILKDEKYFGGIHKKWLSLGDSYELDIISMDNAGFMCALVIAIDHCMHNENNK
jgi:uncharacterized protein YxjI